VELGDMSAAEAEERSARALGSRGWLDIPFSTQWMRR
jgi:hypothetical protein